MIKWPAIIKYTGVAELDYISDESEWSNNASYHHYDFNESDFLIDSAGNLFSLTNKTDEIIKPQSTGNVIKLDEILDLARAHASQAGSCCVAKMYAPSIIEAFNIVKSINEDDE